MKILFLCNTLYQMIAAACIRDMFSNDYAEMILTDHTTNSKKIYENYLREPVIFDHVYYVESKCLYEQDKDVALIERLKMYKDDKSMLEMVSLGHSYDMVFCANAEPFSERLVNYVKRDNRLVKICWFEDGLSAYDYDRCIFPTWVGRLKSKVKNVLSVYGITAEVKEFYVFHPEKMEWHPRAEVKKIEPIKKILAKQLATLFRFSECIDRYEEKYIFFEDGAMDWSCATDVELVKIIAELVGKDNILVKIHPRNPINRFKELGFKTNQDLSIPWEIIAPNIDIEDKVLITMYSQSVITPEILLGRNGKVIALGDIEGYKDKTVESLFGYIKRQYLEKNMESYYIPKTVHELKEIIRLIG